MTKKGEVEKSGRSQLTKIHDQKAVKVLLRLAYQISERKQASVAEVWNCISVIWRKAENRRAIKKALQRRGAAKIPAHEENAPNKPKPEPNKLQVGENPENWA